jgi:hypothetical protein
MASTAQVHIEDLTFNNQGITDLRELLFLSILKNSALSDVCEFNFGVKKGKKVAGIGEFSPVGKSTGANCAPDWQTSQLATVEKEWSPEEWNVAEKICYKDFEETVLKWVMNTGNDIGDFTGTDAMDIVIEPALKKAIEKMYWRLVWLGDVDAKNVAGGGVILNGLDINLFNVCDGLFKQLFALPAAQRVTIAANTATTKALQRSGIFVSGVATSIFDNLIYNAPMALRQKSDAVIYCTQSLGDALSADLKANNKGSDLQWQSLFDGFAYATQYNTVKIFTLPIWDTMIQSFEGATTGGQTPVALFNKPHRAVFGTKEMLKVGVESNEMLQLLRIWFEQKDQQTYMLAKDKLDTKIWEDDLFMVAY